MDVPSIFPRMRGGFLPHDWPWWACSGLGVRRCDTSLTWSGNSQKLPLLCRGLAAKAMHRLVQEERFQVMGTRRCETTGSSANSTSHRRVCPVILSHDGLVLEIVDRSSKCVDLSSSQQPKPKELAAMDAESVERFGQATGLV